MIRNTTKTRANPMPDALFPFRCVDISAVNAFIKNANGTDKNTIGTEIHLCIRARTFAPCAAMTVQRWCSGGHGMPISCQPSYATSDDAMLRA
jgi:hypothetical protein